MEKWLLVRPQPHDHRRQGRDRTGHL